MVGKIDDHTVLIFKLVAKGQTSAEIAVSLEMDRARVDRVIQRTCRQLGVSSRHAAASMIARHHDWPLPGDAGQAQGKSLQTGINRSKSQSEPAATKRERIPSHLYVSDVETPSISKKLRFDTGDEFTSKRPKILVRRGRSYIERLLVLALLVASAALALAALVAAMQGFNVIITS